MIDSDSRVMTASGAICHVKKNIAVEADAIRQRTGILSGCPIPRIMLPARKDNPSNIPTSPVAKYNSTYSLCACAKFV